MLSRMERHSNITAEEQIRTFVMTCYVNSTNVSVLTVLDLSKEKWSQTRTTL